jgi:VIT1/CCC1 family predicted Fe2+/Mn2+ transporter
MPSQDDAARYRDNRQDEMNSAALSRTFAALEPQTQLAQLYERLATVEDRHARFWEQYLRAAGESVPPPRPSWRARVLIWLAKRFGPQWILPTIATFECVDRHMYDRQPEAQQTRLPVDERSHARLLSAIVGKTGLEGNALARFEGRHRAIGGNALRAAVLGANDGLVSNLSLVMGVEGAALSGPTILVTGLAGLLAGACSMAMGEGLSVQSARELNQQQLATEAEEIEQVPEEEQQELALIYEAKGLTEDEATAIAAKLMAEKDSALDALAREELGIDPQELGSSAWAAAGTSFVLFAGGALVPVVPFLYLTGTSAVVVSLLVSALALFLVGAAITLFTGRSVLATGLRQWLLGAVAAGVTYGIGRLLGVTLAG